MKVKINTHGNALPEVHGEWIDLCTAEDVTLDFLEYKIISLGVSIEIPAGYYAHVVPRSSTFGKWGILLANSMGVIENDYCGDGDVWGYPALCLRKEGTQIPKGTRICQFRLVEKAPDMEFVQVESLGNRHCKCGKSFRYKTNAEAETITHSCLDCKAPVDMELNGKGTAYVTIGVRGGKR